MATLALLWHMHQPYYEDLASGEHILPWVRLHALKDYWGMVALLDEFPDVRVTFNLVPSLLAQVEAYADDRAHDRHLQVGLKPAAALDEQEREFLVANGFHAQFERMIRPYPRYAALHARRARRERFDDADLRDLQVLHKLVWMDPDWLVRDPRLAALVAKGEGYREDDKVILRTVELELLRAVLPAYRAAAASGRVELSTSPFYHPILPLLCDTEVHRRAHPDSALPHALFSRPGDAALQLSRAFAFHERIFGHRPQGVWPSEGSLSDEVIGLLSETGAYWTATDEDLLARSLGRAVGADDLYRPYILGTDSRPVRALFRDHQLSDLIGFTYQSWDAALAADDFVRRVLAAAARVPGTDETATVVTVILDGENAWEHYAGGGRPFLRELYRRLQSTPGLQTATMSTAASTGPGRRLASVFPGSWINADFYIWAGHRDDHTAWAQLAAARAAFDAHQGGVSAEARARAEEELLIAEGSDWFWWYGDDHSSDHDREFDDLFRRHLRNVYAALAIPAPDGLYLSNITTETANTPGVVRPTSFSAPLLDGRRHDMAWATATSVALAPAASAMHRVGHLVQALRVACDRETLFLRIDGDELARRVGAGEVWLELASDSPAARRLALTGNRAPGPWAADEVVTSACRFAALGGQAGDRLRLSVAVRDVTGGLIERHPDGAALEVEVPTRHVRARYWVV